MPSRRTKLWAGVAIRHNGKRVVLKRFHRERDAICYMINKQLNPPYWFGKIASVDVVRDTRSKIVDWKSDGSQRPALR